jgi:uncharacterized membrane protein
MRARLRNIWEGIASSLWLVPALLVAGAGALAALTLLVDELVPELRGLRPWLFGGTASAARGLLGNVAGSLITVVALAFSVTIVAIQQASSQFSPRVIRNFMRDRGNQVVFGAYSATFVYALLILRQVREDRDGASEFIPALSVTVALLLALVCVGLLIYFIHHTATSLQVATIIDNIRREVERQLDELYPADAGAALGEGRQTAGAPPLPDGPPALIVRSPGAGFLLALDVDTLTKALSDDGVIARVRPAIGDFVLTGAPLLDLWGSEAGIQEDQAARLAGLFALGRERSHRQDLLFGVRQLVDIALKALSPGVNDPTTAEHCLNHLADIVARLAGRPFPDPWRITPGGALLVLNRPDFPEIVESAFAQIRRTAANDAHVTGHLLDRLAEIAPRATAPERRAALRRQVRLVLEALDRQGFTDGDRHELLDRAHAAFASLGDDLPVPVAAGTGDPSDGGHPSPTAASRR